MTDMIPFRKLMILESADYILRALSFLVFCALIVIASSQTQSVTYSKPAPRDCETK